MNHVEPAVRLSLAVGSVALAGLLAGCGLDYGSDSFACSIHRACPEGYQCLAGVCRGAADLLAFRAIPDLGVAGAPVGVNLISNGDFGRGTTGWRNSSYVDPAPCSSANRTTPIVTDSPFNAALELRSVDGTGCGGSSSVTQDLLVDPAVYSSIILSASVKAVSTTTALTCGYSGGEAPVNIDIVYTNAGDATRNTLRWQFYYLTGASGETCGLAVDGPKLKWVLVPVQRAAWHTHQSVDIKTLIPWGAKLTSVSVMGTGWNYVGRVAQIKLMAQIP
jgi:hypothetical protein